MHTGQNTKKINDIWTIIRHFENAQQIETTIEKLTKPNQIKNT